MKKMLLAFLILISCNLKRNQSAETAQIVPTDTLFKKSANIENIDCSEEELTLSELNMIRYLAINNENTNYYEEGKAFNKFLKIELIDKQIFDNQFNHKIDYFLTDTLNVRKIDGKITLHCTEKDVILEDIEDDNAVYTYLGQYDFLNQYVIGISLYENYVCQVIDKTNGEKSAYLEEFPYISSDKQHIICIYSNPYEATADVELYKIKGQKINRLVAASYINWMPIYDNDWTYTMFWASDGYFYLKVIHSKFFWNGNDKLNNECQCQYLKIKIL